MNTSYIKLNAKRSLVKSHFRCFLISALPYVTIILFCFLNYYLYILLKDISFEFLPFTSFYAIEIRATLLTISVCLSILLWRTVKICTSHYFYMKSHNRNISLASSFKTITITNILTIVTTEILKFFLSVAWGVLFFSPCILVSATLLYYLGGDDFNRNIGLTLLICSTILFFIGAFFLYITLKRYSMCYPVVFSTNEKDSLKVIEKSIEIMEGKSFQFSIFNLSFLGWMTSCVLLLPLIYVLPYKTIAKYSFFNCISSVKKTQEKENKPIIFYIQKRVEN